jgi:hypothetical protein
MTGSKPSKPTGELGRWPPAACGVPGMGSSGVPTKERPRATPGNRRRLQPLPAGRPKGPSACGRRRPSRGVSSSSSAEAQADEQVDSVSDALDPASVVSSSSFSSSSCSVRAPGLPNSRAVVFTAFLALEVYGRMPPASGPLSTLLAEARGGHSSAPTISGSVISS